MNNKPTDGSTSFSRLFQAILHSPSQDCKKLCDSRLQETTQTKQHSRPRTSLYKANHLHLLVLQRMH